MLELAENALIVFVSDSHIGGDPGCDGFESPEELRDLFEELAEREGPVELVLAGDFFDFLQIGEVPEGTDRAAMTIECPEYVALFEALGRFRGGEGKRVVYLPGNHDAEMWWDPKIGETLRGRGLVDELAFSYLASFEVGGERRVVYCEHGNQFDPANTVRDYADPLDTPLGHHVVTDFTRRVAPFGEVASGLDLSEIKMVYPLVEIPRWISSRYFYDLVGKATAYLILPLLIAYAVYRIAAYALAISSGDPGGLLRGYQELPWVHELFLELAFYGLLVLVVFAVFFFVVRRTVHKTITAVNLKRQTHYSPAEDALERIRQVVLDASSPPMSPSLKEIDVFVSGHTHLPSLNEVEKDDGGRAVMVNSGCWLRQLQPVAPRLKGPPIFVSRFVLTYVRVFVRGGAVRVELWEQPKPATQRLTRIERLLAPRHREPQPGSKPRLRAAVDL